MATLAQALLGKKPDYRAVVSALSDKSIDELQALRTQWAETHPREAALHLLIRAQAKKAKPKEAAALAEAWLLSKPELDAHLLDEALLDPPSPTVEIHRVLELICTSLPYALVELCHHYAAQATDKKGGRGQGGGGQGGGGGHGYTAGGGADASAPLVAALTRSLDRFPYKTSGDNDSALPLLVALLQGADAAAATDLSTQRLMEDLNVLYTALGAGRYDERGSPPPPTDSRSITELLEACLPVLTRRPRSHLLELAEEYRKRHGGSLGAALGGRFKGDLSHAVHLLLMPSEVYYALKLQASLEGHPPHARLCTAL